jgi:hypothetical protein
MAHEEMRKVRVGPCGTRAMRMYDPKSVAEKMMKWVTPSGPAT